MIVMDKLVIETGEKKIETNKLVIEMQFTGKVLHYTVLV